MDGWVAMGARVMSVAYMYRCIYLAIKSAYWIGIYLYPSDVVTWHQCLHQHQHLTHSSTVCECVQMWATSQGKMVHSVGRRGSVVAYTACKQDVAGLIAASAEFAVGAVPLGKAFTHTCTVSTQEWKWVPGRTEKPCVCVWLVMCTKTCSCRAVCSPGSWDGLWMNRVLWPGGNCVKSGEQRLRWILAYKPPPLPFTFCTHAQTHQYIRLFTTWDSLVQ